jgi:hypothetical protein
MSKRTASLALLVLLAFAAPANSQRVSIGVVGGAALTDAFPNQFYSYSVISSSVTGIRT